MILAEIIDELLRRRHRLADERPERPQDQPVVAVVASQEQRPVSGRASAAQQRFDETLSRADQVLRERLRRERAAMERADAEQRRSDDAEVRADDDRCRDLAAAYQEDFARHGAEPPLFRSDEWSDAYERRLLRSLQRRLDPASDLANTKLLDGVRGPAFRNFAEIIRQAAADEAAKPSYSNLPESVYDPRAKLERQDSATGARTIEWRARTSFIADMKPLSKRAFIADPRT